MLPYDFWSKENTNLKAVLMPHIQSIALDGVQSASDKLANMGIVIDNSLVLAEAAVWARKYTDDLLNILGTTNQRVVGEMIANWSETPGSTLEMLREQLKPVLGGNDSRAQTVAVTEVTRAVAGGEMAVYQKAGLGKVLIAPPAHVRCRCWTRVVSINKVLYVVWSSNSDEPSECNHEIDTPWGETIYGCKSMDGRIISEGNRLGTRI